MSCAGHDNLCTFKMHVFWYHHGRQITSWREVLIAYADFDGEERADCFALFVFLVSRDCCLALPHNVTGLSAVCDCGIS